MQETIPASVSVSDLGRVKVSRVVFDGSSVFSDSVLQQLVQPYVGHDLDLPGLEAMADAVERYYREAGYALVRVVVPAQQVDRGELRLQILEGRLARINIQREPSLRLNADRIHSMLARIPLDKPIHLPSLERVLLLLSDMPGVEVRSTLRSGQAPGTVDLDVSLTQSDWWQGKLGVDNFGNRYTGKNRATLNMQFVDLSGWGDRFSLGLMRSDGSLRNYSLRWSLPIGNAGLVAHAGYSKVDYQLGGEFNPLGVTGQARRMEFGLHQPWLRSREFSSWVYLTLARNTYQESWSALDMDNPKRTKTVQLGLSGQWRDSFAGGGVNAWDVSATTGWLDIQSSAQRAWDDVTAQRQGRYLHFNLAWDRLQRLDERWTLAVGVKGQLAQGNLDSSSQFYLGGPQGVRAYESGVGGGDQGWSGQMELRRQIKGGLHAFGFYDVGYIQVNKRPWTHDKNSFDLHAYGLGAHWDFGRYGHLRAVLALRPDLPEGWQTEGSRRRVWLSASLVPEALPALVHAAAPNAEPEADRRSKVEIFGTINTSLEFASRTGATSADESRSATIAAMPNGTNIDRSFRMVSNSSEFGIRGSENLGGGTRAWYQIESSFNAVTGTGSLAARNTAVGLRSRHWGNLLLGKWDSPYKAATFGFDPFGGTQVAAYTNILGNPGFGISVGGTSTPIKTATDGASSNGDASFARRQENSIQYWTPNWAGISARLMVSTGGERISPLAGRPSVWAGSLTWQHGGMRLAAAYEQHDNFFGVATFFSRRASGRGIGSRIGPLQQTRSRDYGVKLGARYDWGSTRVSLIWERLVYSQTGVVPASNPTLMRHERDAVWLGVRHRAGAWTYQWSAGYADKGSCRVASVDPAQQSCGTSGLEAYMLSLGARYSLSRRTDMYVQYARIFNGKAASYNFSPGGVLGAGVGSDPQAVGFGVIHRF